MRRTDTVCLLFSHRTACPCAEDEAFEQRVAGQSVGAVHARACDLAGGEQSGNRRSSVEIGLHPAHDVMRCGTHWNPIAREVEAGPPAHFRDQREPLMNKVSIQSFQRQVHRLIRAPTFTDDRSRNPVARCEIRGSLISAHERLTRPIHQLRSFSTQRL